MKQNKYIIIHYDEEYDDWDITELYAFDIEDAESQAKTMFKSMSTMRLKYICRAERWYK